MNWTKSRARSARALLALLGGTLSVAVLGTAAATTPAARARSGTGHAALAPPAVPRAGAYLGADPNYSDGQSTPEQAALLAKQIGRPLGIVSFYVAFTSPVPVAEMAEVADTGAIPMISVHCGAPDSDVAAGKYDGLLESQAAAYRSYGRPVLFRWFWEMNFSKIENHASCLGASSTAAHEYVAAFQHIWTVFHDAGATNVAFVWAPSAAAHAPNPAAFYPGARYVSWIGADIYDRTGYGPWSTMYAPFYDVWSRQGKPLIVTETGAVGSDAQAGWLKNIEEALPTSFPDVHAWVYVDAVDIFDYRLVPGSAGFAAYVAIAANPYFLPPRPEDGWLLATSSGSVENYGCLGYGSAPGPLPAPVVGIAAPPGGSGYWLAGTDGSVYAFGSARPYGSMRGRHLNKPVVGIAATIDGRGYWLVASDGGIFTFGDAHFRGSTGAMHLNKPIVGMAATTDGNGYWLVASDGGIFTFGDARYRGSLVGISAGSPVVGIATDPATGDYRLVTSGGRVYQFALRDQLAFESVPGQAVGIVTVN